MNRVIQVERDPEGLHLALRCLFEEALVLHRTEGLRAEAEAQADAETLRQLDADMPVREISPGYFKRAAYLLDLSSTLELGIPLDPASILHTDVLGLQVVKSARADYERDHPACSACGERQDNRWMNECFSCHTKFPGRGN